MITAKSVIKLVFCINGILHVIPSAGQILSIIWYTWKVCHILRSIFKKKINKWNAIKAIDILHPTVMVLLQLVCPFKLQWIKYLQLALFGMIDFSMKNRIDVSLIGSTIVLSKGTSSKSKWLELYELMASSFNEHRNSTGSPSAT